MPHDVGTKMVESNVPTRHDVRKVVKSSVLTKSRRSKKGQKKELVSSELRDSQSDELKSIHDFVVLGKSFMDF
jgi:hypothetical protein